MSTGEPVATPAPRRPASRLIQVTGIVVALVAVVLCVRTLADEWSNVSSAVEHANVALMVVAFVSAAAAMIGLAVLWWGCLRVFDAPARLRDATAWYFAGEFAKYLPGGVWSVLGRGELARRGGGISRGDAYGTTLIGYGVMCVGAGYTCAILAPVLAVGGDRLSWGWIMIALVPVGAAGMHPAVLGRLLNVARRVSRGRLDLLPPSWRQMLGLSVVAVPTWALVGLSSVLVTSAFHFDQNPARVAFAAVAAWVIGFLAVPVPAGAGLRELVFVGTCGLTGDGHGVVVAAGARILLIVVDVLGGMIGLWYARRSARRSPAPVGATTAERGPSIAQR